MRTQIYDVNLVVGAGIPPIVKVSQNDELRVLAFRLFDGIREYFPFENEEVIITGTKPSGLGFTEVCNIIGSLATVETTLAMTQESGSINAELRISDGSTNIGTANFTLYVEPAPHPAGTTDGTTEEARTVLEQCAQYAQEAHEAASDVAPQVESLVDAAVADKMEEIEDAVQSVTDAATQAVSDITAAGEAVEESIPADYTALSTQVGTNATAISQLQADLGNISIAGVNLFDKDNANIFIGYPNKNDTTFKSSSGARTVWIRCKPNTTYTVSKIQSSRFAVAWGSNEPIINSTFDDMATHHANTAITVTTSATATYLAVLVWNASTDASITLEQVLSSLQIEYGSAATEYQEYALTALDKIARAKADGVDSTLSEMEEHISVVSPSIPTYGENLLTNFASMTAFGGSTYANNKWTLVPNGGIKTNLSVESGKGYLIEMNVDSVEISDGSANYRINPLTISFGNDSIDIFANFDANWRVLLVPDISGTAELSFTCNPYLTVVMNGLSVRAVKSYPNTPLEINGSPVYNSEIGGYSSAFGGGHAKRIGTSNTAFGYMAQRDINTGLTNSAFGYNAQRDITNGRSNSAFGNRAQEKITTGMYNNAVGTVAQGFLTSGCWNNAFGNEVQRDLTTGNNNVGIGRRAQSYLTTGNMNTAIGSLSGFAVEGHQDGSWATKTASFQTLIGGETTQASANEANYLTAIGYRAKGEEKATAIGAMASATGEGSVAIGYNVSATEDNQVVIGADGGSVCLCGKRIIFNADHTVTWEDVT